MGSSRDNAEETMGEVHSVYVTKETCALRGKASERMANNVEELTKSVNELTVETTKSLGEVATSLASLTQWMKDHEKHHTESWSKLHTIAVVGASVIALCALGIAGANALGLFTPQITSAAKIVIP